MIMDIDDLVNEYVNALNMPRTPDFMKVRSDHVFDEEQSVKWNREKAKEHNAKYDEECEKQRLSRNIMIDEATIKIYDYIRQEIPGLCAEAAVTIFEKAKEGSNDYRYDLAENIEDYIEFAEAIRR